MTTDLYLIERYSDMMTFNSVLISTKLAIQLLWHTQFAFNMTKVYSLIKALSADEAFSIECDIQLWLRQMLTQNLATREQRHLYVTLNRFEWVACILTSTSCRFNEAIDVSYVRSFENEVQADLEKETSSRRWQKQTFTLSFVKATNTISTSRSIDQNDLRRSKIL